MTGLSFTPFERVKSERADKISATTTSCHLSEDCGSVKPVKDAGMHITKREQ